MFLWVAVITVLVPAYYSAFCTLCRLSRPRFRPKGLCSLQCAIECPHEAQQKAAPPGRRMDPTRLYTNKSSRLPSSIGSAHSAHFFPFHIPKSSPGTVQVRPDETPTWRWVRASRTAASGRGYEKGRKDGKMDRPVYSTVQYGICQCAFFSVAVNRYRVDMLMDM